MATKIIPESIIDPVSIQINQSIDRLILSLEQRRVQLLTDLRDRREEMRANRVACQQMEQMAQTRAFLERQMTHNDLQLIQEKMVTDLEGKMAEIKVAVPPQEVAFLCDTRDLEEHISRLGEISPLKIPPIPPIPVVPDYSTFQRPIVEVGQEGSAPGQFNGPKGVSIDSESGHIFVADMKNKRIQIFSQTGQFVNLFEHRQLKKPWGILLHQNSIFITDLECNAIFLFKLSNLKVMLKRAGKKGSGIEDFNQPRQLAISPNQHLYVADQNNNRIQTLSTELAFQGSLRHEAMTTPVDVKFSNNEMFVLSCDDSPCVHVFTLSGEKTRSLVTNGWLGMQVKGAYFFCVDQCSNIVINDSWGIKVFSPEGELMHKFALTSGLGLFTSSGGIAIDKDKLICLVDKYYDILNLFC